MCVKLERNHETIKNTDLKTRGKYKKNGAQDVSASSSLFRKHFVSPNIRLR